MKWPRFEEEVIHWALDIMEPLKQQPISLIRKKR